MDNVGLGIALGAGIGVAIGIAIDQRRNKTDKQWMCPLTRPNSRFYWG